MTYSELKTLYDLFDGDRARIKKAIASIEREYVTLYELENHYYIEDLENYYSSDDYVITYHGDIMEMNDTFWCEGMEDSFPKDERRRAYVGRYEYLYSRTYIESQTDLYYFDGDYYDDEAMGRHGLVWVADMGCIGYEDDNYWHERYDEWRSYSSDDDYDDDEDEDERNYVRGYHNGSYREMLFGGKGKYKIGFEIEKEDRDVRNSIDIDCFECDTDGYWRKEKDGSLSDSSGYELISPTFEFNIKKIFEYIESNEVLVEHINADFTKNCGGHINLSQKGLSGHELFDKIKGYTPLFYALYHGRVDKNYCKGKKNDDLKNQNDKYQAIKIHDNRVEFRIISAVPNVETLKWRCRLLMMILRNPTDNVINAYYNVDTKFTKLLSKVYSPERLTVLKDRFKTYTKQFENLNIK